MENCLVKKLKSVVENDALRTFGDLEVSVHLTNENLPVFLNVSVTNKAFSLNSYPTGKVTEAGGFDNYRCFRLSAGDYKIRILLEENATCTHIYSRINSYDSGKALPINPSGYIAIDTQELKYREPIVNNLFYVGKLNDITHYETISNIVSGGIDNIGLHLEGNVSSVNPNITNLQLQDCSDYITGDIAFINNCINLAKVRLISSKNGRGVAGNIGSINNTKLTELILNRNNVAGNIEDFVEAQIENNRDYNSNPWVKLYFSLTLKINNEYPSTARYIYVHFTSTGAQITEEDKTTVIATYDSSNDSWTYA